MKKIITIAFWIILVGGITSLFVFANAKQDSIICPEFEIVVDYRQAPVLITQSDIRREITRQKIKIRGQEVGKIEAMEIQKLLDRNPFVKKATITIGVNGKVKAHLLQRRPLVRVVDQKGFQFYIDDEGSLMPLSHEYPARVVIASGNIKPVMRIRKFIKKDPEEVVYQKLPSDLQKIYLATMAVRCDSFSNALVEQIYLNALGDLEFIPKIGHQTIIIGDTIRLREKLSNLKHFYADGMKSEGWNIYSEINLKYRNQVVCTKSQ